MIQVFTVDKRFLPPSFIQNGEGHRLLTRMFEQFQYRVVQLINI